MQQKLADGALESLVLSRNELMKPPIREQKLQMSSTEARKDKE